jgi:hypothetical protein
VTGPQRADNVLAMDVEYGNAGAIDTRGTGWFVGFSDWARGGGADLRHMPFDARSSGLCMKWFDHPAGHPNGEAKPLSEGRTLCLLVGAGGEFRIDCSTDPAFAPAHTITRVLRHCGDYIAWGAGLHHRAFGLQRTTMLTLRWLPPS